MLLYGYTGCIFFTLLPKPIFPYEMSFCQNPIKYCNMAIYCNTLKHNTQYSIDLYCFTPNTHAYTQTLYTYDVHTHTYTYTHTYVCIHAYTQTYCTHMMYTTFACWVQIYDMLY